MAEFSISEAALTGFRVVREHPRAVLVWAAFQLVFSLLMRALVASTAGPDLIALMANPTPPDQARASLMLGQLIRLAVVVLPFALVFLAILMGAMNRIVLRPAEDRFGYLRLGGDEVRQLCLIALASVVFLGIEVAAAIVAGLLIGVVGGGRASPSSLILALVLVYVAVILFAVRFSLASALTFDRRKVDLFGSWRLTRGRFWPLFGALVITIALAMVIGLLGFVITSALQLVATGGDVGAVFSKTRPNPMGGGLERAQPRGPCAERHRDGAGLARHADAGPGDLSDAQRSRLGRGAVTTIEGAAPSPAQSPAPISPRQVAAAVAGNALEFYDFTLYAFFAVQIGHTFFPNHTAYLSLLLSLATFGVGFVLRPVGALYLGRMSDRRGRRPAMLLSFALMGVSILGLSLTPGYATIGVAAPVLVVVWRLCQGFALGGEVGPTTAYLVEAAPRDKRALYGAWQAGSQNLANIVGGLVGAGLALAIGEGAMAVWGWRAAFLIGALVLPFGWVIRRGLPETLHQHAEAEAQHLSRSTLRSNLPILLMGFGLVAATTVPTYVFNFMTTFAMTTLHMSAGKSLLATVASGSCGLIGGLIGGVLADRVGRRPMMIWPRVASVIITWPAFWLMVRNHDLPTLLGATAVMTFVGALEHRRHPHRHHRVARAQPARAGDGRGLCARRGAVRRHDPGGARGPEAGDRRSTLAGLVHDGVHRGRRDLGLADAGKRAPEAQLRPASDAAISAILRARQGSPPSPMVQAADRPA